MAMSLYEIDSRIQGIIDSIYNSVDENGEVGEIDFTELEQLQEDRKVKLENIALYIKNTEAEANAIKEEELKLKARREKLENKADRLRTLMITSMTAANEPELATPRCHAKIKESKRTQILDIKQIPDEYINIKYPEPEINPDKKAIKKAIEAGKTVAGAAIEIHKTINIE